MLPWVSYFCLPLTACLSLGLIALNVLPQPVCVRLALLCITLMANPFNLIIDSTRECIFMGPLLPRLFTPIPLFVHDVPFLGFFSNFKLKLW